MRLWHIWYFLASTSEFCGSYSWLTDGHHRQLGLWSPAQPANTWPSKAMKLLVLPGSCSPWQLDILTYLSWHKSQMLLPPCRSWARLSSISSYEWLFLPRDLFFLIRINTLVTVLWSKQLNFLWIQLSVRQFQGTCPCTFIFSTEKGAKEMDSREYF